MTRSATPIGVLAALAVAVAGTLAAAPAGAQNRVYRCGNEYTNQLNGRTDCKLVEGGNVTIVRGTNPPPRPAAAPAPSPAAPAATPAAPSAQTTFGDVIQRQRDADRRAILERELERAQKRQAELVAEYNDGEPDKIGGEARNYQKYLDRVAELKASIARNQSDIDGIQRELDRVGK